MAAGHAASMAEPGGQTGLAHVPAEIMDGPGDPVSCLKTPAPLEQRVSSQVRGRALAAAVERAAAGDNGRSGREPGSVAAAPSSRDAAAAGPSGSAAGGQQELAEVARQFESIFIQTMLRAMRQTVPESSLLDEGNLRIYRQLHDEELARAAARGPTGLGIARLIVEHYGRQHAVDGGSGGVAVGPAPLPAPSVPAASSGATWSTTVPAVPATVEPRAAVAGYRREQAGDLAARYARLRRMGTRLGEAYADSLRRWGSSLARASADTGVEPSLLFAVLMTESGGDPLARSPRGAEGLMQLMPATAAEVGVEDPRHPGQNILGGARYLARQLDRFGGDQRLALAAYNAGPAAVEAAGRQVPPFAETRSYVDEVLELRARLQGR
jgi:Rod binding domain-containing protein